MSSREIADLVRFLHDDVKRSIDRLVASGVDIPTANGGCTIAGQIHGRPGQ